MVVRELLTRLGFQVDDGKLKKYEQSTNNIKTNAEGAANAFRNVFAAFAGVAAIKSIANTADLMQSMEARIGMLPQTVGAAGTAFEEVAKHATAARQGVEAYGTLYTRIGNAAKKYLTTQEDVLQVTDAVSKALVVGGASGPEQASAMLQLSQALGSGVLQGQEFNAMAEAAPQLLDQLSEAMGYPREQLKKLASEGKITTKELVMAFKKIGPDIDKQFLKMPMTIGQAVTIMGNKWAVFIAKMNRESGAVTAVANFIVGAMDKISNGLDSFVEAVGGATNALKLLGIVGGAIVAAWIPSWYAAAAATLAATWPIYAIIGGFVLLGLLLEDVYNWFQGNDSLLGDLIGNSSAWASEIENLKIVFNALAAVLGWLWENLLKPLGVFTFWAMGESITALFNTVLALYQVFKGVWDVIQKIASVAVTGPGAEADARKAAMNAPPPNAVAAATVAGAAAAPGGVPTATGPTQNNTITVQAAPGTPEANKEAARAGTTQALDASQKLARQAGQAQ